MATKSKLEKAKKRFHTANSLLRIAVIAAEHPDIKAIKHAITNANNQAKKYEQLASEQRDRAIKLTAALVARQKELEPPSVKKARIDFENALRERTGTYAELSYAPEESSLSALDLAYQKALLDAEPESVKIARNKVEQAGAGEISSLLDAWRAAADDLNDQREVLAALLANVEVDLRQGRIVAWHARPEYAAAVEQAARHA